METKCEKSLQQLAEELRLQEQAVAATLLNIYEFESMCNKRQNENVTNDWKPKRDW